jgi:AcrR family transcriptional regulator
MVTETQKKAATRDSIMRALADEILERGAHDFSVQGVADRAGIAHRTVYRYFPTREALFHAYGDWLNEQLGAGATETPNDIRRLALASVGAFQRFDRVPEFTKAYVRITLTGAAIDTRSERTRSFVRLADRDASTLDKRHRRALAAVLRQVVSSETWVRAREEFGANGAELGDIVGWVVNLVGDALEAGQTPDDWQGKSK